MANVREKNQSNDMVQPFKTLNQGSLEQPVKEEQEEDEEEEEEEKEEIFDDGAQVQDFNLQEEQQASSSGNAKQSQFS